MESYIKYSTTTLFIGSRLDDHCDGWKWFA